MGIDCDAIGSAGGFMRALLATGFLVTVILLPTAGMATPSTQIWIPSPDTVSFLNVHLGADNYFTIFRKTNNDAWAAPIDIGLTVGVVPSDVFGFEIGVDLFEPSDSPLAFNAKASLVEDGLFEHMPGVAVGIYGVGLEKNVTDMNIVYGLVGKHIWKLGRFSAGYYWGNKMVLLRPNGEPDEHGLLLSWDRTIEEISEKLWLAVDYQQGRNVMGAIGLGAGWSFFDQIGVIVGFVFYGNGSPGTITVQLDIDFAIVGTSNETAPSSTAVQAQE